MTTPDTDRTLRRSLRAIDLRAQLERHAQQLAAQASRQGRSVGYWDTIPGLPRAVIEARRAELRAIEARPHGLAQSERGWIPVEQAAIPLQRAA